MDADLIQHQVSIPGIEPPTTVFAVDQDEALREALDMQGLHFAPPGTVVYPVSQEPR